MAELRYENLEFRDHWSWQSEGGVPAYRTGVIHGELLYSELIGAGSTEQVRLMAPTLDAAYREGGLAGKSFMRIVDCSKMTHVSLSARKAYVKLLNTLNEKHDCKPVVSYICGASFLIRNSIRLLSAFVRQELVFLDSVEEAFARAREARESHMQMAITFEDIIFKDEWSYENPETGYGYAFGIVPGRLFYYHRKGKATLDEVKHVFEVLLPTILVESDFDNRSIDFIWEITDGEGLSMPIRRYIFRALQKVQKQHNAKLSGIYICGKRGMLWSIMNALSRALGVKICFVPNKEDALARIARKTPSASGELTPATIRIKPTHIQELSDYFCQLLFVDDQTAPPPCPLSPDNPLQSVQELIDAAKVDLQELRENDRRLTQSLREEIRERERSEAMLIQAERLSAVGTLAGGVAHEFNNINCSILGFAEIGLTVKELPENAREYFKRISLAGRRASAVTRRLLEFACPSSGNWSLGDLREVMQGAIEMMRHELISSGVTLQEDLRSTPPTPMDSHMLGQVALNLLINALHAMTGREAKRLDLACGEDNGELFFRVADNGCGMDEETQKQIFTPFFSQKGEHAQNNSPLANLRGSGLGLSICYTIVEKHGGRIECESAPDNGATFTVRIPLRKTAGEEARDTAPSPIARTEPLRGRMLVLDDEADIREIVETIFAHNGMTVVALEDGHQALRACSEKQFDLVLLDLQMAAMDGSTFLQRLRALPDIAQPKVIVMSGKTSTLDATEAEAHEVECILEKPFDINALRNAVHACFS